ncbi:MAG: WXG100 family type VII secretion target [Pseudonocardiaceae bacterium]
MAQSIDDLERTLDELDGFIREITAVWTGAASDAFHNAVVEWNKAARDMRDELAYLHRLVTTAHSNHVSAVRTNSAMWQV